MVNAGSAYLYRVEQNGTVSHLSKFTASDAIATDKFGSSVSLSGNLLAVGSYDDDHAGGVDAGSAYLFQLEQNGSVTEVGKVTASDADANDEFGRSVSLFGDTFAVGAYMHDPNGLNSAGAAYLSDWSRTDRFPSSKRSRMHLPERNLAFPFLWMKIFLPSGPIKNRTGA